MNLPSGVQEQEIPIVNIQQPPLLADVPKYDIDSLRDIRYQDRTQGFIDPRPLAMANLANTFNTIFEHNGLLILLAGGKTAIGYHRDGRQGI